MPKDIGKTLKECRAASKMSVKEISDLLTKKGFKASESTIYSWENGNSQPTPGALLTMCTAYGIDNVLETFGYNGYDNDGSIQLNLNEIEHIEKYRLLDPHGKDMVDTVLIKEYDRCQEQAASTSNIVQLKDADRSYLLPDAAHARTDVPHTAEGQKHDDDIMYDDSEWT